jgi:hypothetical protein
VSTTFAERKLKHESVSAAPEQLFPCRSKLMALLSEHSAIVAGLEEFESRLQRSQLDLNEAISRDDDVEISRFQGMESVFNLKLSAKRSNLKQLESTIPTAISSASNEFGTALMQERDRRISILAKQIGATLGTDSDRLISGRYLDDLWDESPAVQAVDQLRLNINLIGASSDTVLTTAQTLLDHFEALIKASKETV